MERIWSRPVGVLDLEGPDYWAERELAQALLLTEDATDQLIGDTIGFTAKAVGLYEELWYHVRPYRHNPLFLTSLLNARSSAGEEEPEDFGFKLRRLVCRGASAKAVLAMAGIPEKDQESATPRKQWARPERNSMTSPAASAMRRRTGPRW